MNSVITKDLIGHNERHGTPLPPLFPFPVPSCLVNHLHLQHQQEKKQEKIVGKEAGIGVVGRGRLQPWDGLYMIPGIDENDCQIDMEEKK